MQASGCAQRSQQIPAGKIQPHHLTESNRIVEIPIGVRIGTRRATRRRTLDQGKQLDALLGIHASEQAF